MEISRFATLTNLYNYFEVFPYKNFSSYTPVTRLISVEDKRKWLSACTETFLAKDSAELWEDPLAEDQNWAAYHEFCSL